MCVREEVMGGVCKYVCTDQKGVGGRKTMSSYILDFRIHALLLQKIKQLNSLGTYHEIYLSHNCTSQTK